LCLILGSFLDTVRYTIPTEEPEFVDQIPNVTIALGRDAKLPCIVNNLETYRVSAFYVDPKYHILCCLITGSLITKWLSITISIRKAMIKCFILDTSHWICDIFVLQILHWNNSSSIKIHWLIINNKTNLKSS
jgi:hypothetical protein